MERSAAIQASDRATSGASAPDRASTVVSQAAPARLGMQSTWRTLGSLRLTVVLLAALAAGVTAATFGGWPMTWPVAIPVALLAGNLGVALFTHEVFRRNAALTVFHVFLIALMLLFAFGRLTYFKGKIEVTEGQAFDGVPIEAEYGPWHPNRLDRIELVNEHFEIDYSADTTIRGTRNAVRWRDAAGHWQDAVIRENEPVVLLGYRIYVTGGKGFAPTFVWHADGRSTAGSVHLPRFPSDEHAQQAEWTLPDGHTRAWVALHFDRPPLPPGQVARLVAPATDGHRIVLRIAGTTGVETRHELRPGESVALPGGRLEFVGTRLWMGYLLHYDWTVPWLLGVSTLATLALAAHYVGKYGRKEW
jgi:cytochrome c biogenesis protein